MKEVLSATVTTAIAVSSIFTFTCSVNAISAAVDYTPPPEIRQEVQQQQQGTYQGPPVNGGPGNSQGSGTR